MRVATFIQPGYDMNVVRLLGKVHAHTIKDVSGEGAISCPIWGIVKE